MLSAVDVHQDDTEALRELLVTDSDLSFLQELSPEGVHALRAEIEAYVRRTEEAQQPVYKTMAAVTRFVPNFVIARVGGTLPPYVMAQVTHHLDVKSAAGMAKLFEPELLGEVALHIHAELAGQISSKVSFKQLCAVMDVMRTRGFFRKLGEVSDQVDPELLARVAAQLKDPADTARITMHMQDMDRVQTVAQRLPGRVVQAIAEELARLGEQRLAGMFLR